MTNDNYNYLREQYPPYVCKEQLYTICKISKYAAKYLLDNRIIPCRDTGRKSWRYQISLEDIIAYLRKRDETGSTLIPYGDVSRSIRKNKAQGNSFSQSIMFGSTKEIREYFEYTLKDFPQLLNLSDMTQLTGLSAKTIQRKIKSNAIQTIRNGNQYLFPKPYVLDYVTSSNFLNTKSNSCEFRKVLDSFKVWKKRSKNRKLESLENLDNAIVDTTSAKISRSSGVQE